jgi:uncharacterized membrane protein YgcG
MHALALILLAASPVSPAPPDCAARVVDAAGLVKDDAVVAQSLEALRALGIDAHAVTLKSHGDASSLDAAVERMEARCPAWQSAGEQRGDLLVIAVSLKERTSGIYYGSDLEARLAPVAERLRDDVMGPHLRKGDFDGAFIAVADETAHVLTAAHEATPSSASAPVPNGSRGTGVAILGVFALVVAGAWGGAWAWRRARRGREQARALAAARAEAEAARARCTNDMAGMIQETADLDERLEILRSQVDESEREPLRASLAEAQQRLDEATVAQSKLTEEATSLKTPSIEDHVRARDAFAKLSEELAPTSRTIEAARTGVDALVEAVAAVDATLASAGKARAEADAKLAAAVPAGFRTDSLEAALRGAAKRLEEARALAAQRRPGRAVAAAKEAEGVVARTLATAARLPEVKTEADAALPGLRARIDRVADAVTAARQVFDAMAASFAESCWSSVRGNGTEAQGRLDAARHEMETAEAFAREGDWAGALDDVQDAGGHLDEAESLLRSIHARSEHLDKAKHDAPSEIEAASSDVERAQQFLRENPGRYGRSVEQGLELAQQRLAEARDQSGRDKPDYVVLVTAAQEANRAADAVLATAVQEHAEGERLAREAASVLRDAERKISKVAEYLEDHARDVPSLDVARTRLQEARDALASASAEGEPARQVELARRAQDRADASYQRAAQLVERADSDRRRGGGSWGSPWIITTGGSRSGAGWSGGGWSGGGGGGGTSGGWGGRGGGVSGGWGGGHGGGVSGGW